MRKKLFFSCLVLSVLLMPSVSTATPLHVGTSTGVTYVEFTEPNSYTVGGSISISDVNALVLDNGVLHVGHGQGLSALNVVGTGYADTGYFFGLPPVAAMDADSAGVLHVGHSGGLSDFGYSGATGYSSSGAYIFIPGIGAVLVDGADVIHAGHGGGMSAVLYSAGSYSSPGSQYFNVPPVAALAVAGDVVHVGHAQGLSALQYDHTLNQYADTGAYINAGQGAVAIDADGGIHAGNPNGLSYLAFTGSSYAAGGFFPLPGITSVAIDADGYIHVGHSGGLSAFRYDTVLDQYVDTGAFIYIPGITSLVAGPWTCLQSIPADFTGDCRVALDDFAIFAGYWLDCNRSDPSYCQP